MSTNDIVSIFLSIELQSYGLYILSTIYRNSELSTTGGLMYFLLGALSSCFILLGWPGNSGLTLLLAGPLLPNSGETLVSTVPTCEGGWTNQSCTVTSWKIQETEEGNRGSKLVILRNVTEKEQRVNGSRHGIILPCLRCTLQSFYWNSKIGILSNQINKQITLYLTERARLYSTIAAKLQIKLDPNLITGFVDGEASFSISSSRNLKLKLGWIVRPVFVINLHQKDRVILELIQSTLGVGTIYDKKINKVVSLKVSRLTDFKVIIDHFNKYPLITQKRSDYQLFKKIVDLINRKEHLTTVGLQQIINIRASINKGLSPELKAAFPNTIPVLRPLVANQVITNPNWVSGFTSAEGCFFINILKSSKKIRETVQLVFQITQHNRDEQLMKSLVSYFGCGRYVSQKKEFGYFIVTKFSDITEKIIPFFNKYQVVGVKALDFSDFCKAAELIKNKDHLTKKGIDKIHLIKAGMNTKRITSSINSNSLSGKRSISTLTRPIVNSTGIKTPGSFGTEGCSARVGGTNTNLNPWFITGFIEGEGCFVVNVIKNNRLKTGWRIQIEFKIGLHKRDWELLEKIKKFFGVGKVYKQGENAAQYMIHTVKELAVILNHLDKYPPITAKKISDIKQLKLVVNLILNKEHLTDEGVKKIIYIKASMNKGLSVNNLKHAIFQGIKIHPYLALPEVESAIVDSRSGTLIHHSMEKGQTEPGLIADNKIISEGTFQSPQRSQAVSSIPHPFWLAGFTSAEGCFSVNIINSSTHKIKKRVLLVFSLSQHIREEQLMKSIKDFFSGGFVRKTNNVLQYRIETYSDIENKVIPLFNKHRVEGEKYLNFKDWCKVWELIENKAHLTLEGLNLIKEIKSGMNKRRSTSTPPLSEGVGSSHRARVGSNK